MQTKEKNATSMANSYFANQSKNSNYSTILKVNKAHKSFATPKIKNQEKEKINSKKKKIKTNQVVEYFEELDDLPTTKEKSFELDWLGNSANKSVLQTMRLKEAGKVVASIKRNQIDAYDELESYKRLVKKRKKRLIARICTFLLLLIVAPIMIFFGTIIIDNNSRHDFFGLTFFIVVSESMQPEIMVNDCVALKKVTNVYDLKVGDDIGYINDKGAVVVHRIESIVETDSGILEFVTHGINNASADQKRVGFEQVVGKRVATLSVLGNAVVFFRSAPGIVLFVTLFIGTIAAFYVAFGLSENIKYVENVD